VAEVLAAHLTDGEGLLASIPREGARLEHKCVPPGQRRGKLVLEDGWVVFGGFLHTSVSVSAASHEDVKHIILEAK
jgi:hypothetical protein